MKKKIFPILTVATIFLTPFVLMVIRGTENRQSNALKEAEAREMRSLSDTLDAISGRPDLALDENEWR